MSTPLTFAHLNAGNGARTLNPIGESAAPVTCFDIQKTGGVDLTYDGSSYTNETFTGTCSIEWTLDDNLVNFIIGLSADPGGVSSGTVDLAGCSQGDNKFYKVVNAVVTYPNLASIPNGSKMRVVRTMPGGATTLDVDTGGTWTNVGTGPTMTGTLHAEVWFRGSSDYVTDVKVKSAGVDQAVTWTSSNNTVTACGGLGGGGGSPAWTIDATSGHAFPANGTEHAAFETNYGTTMGAPDLIWNCQETSGNVADTSGNSRTGTVTSALAYDQTVSGFTRKAITFAAAGGGSIVTTSVPNASSNSCTAIAVCDVTSVTVASQAIMFYGTTQIAQVRFTTTPRMQHRSGGNVATGTANPTTAGVMPYALRFNRTAGDGAAYNTQEKVAATHATTPTGAQFTIAGGPPPAMKVLYVIAWFSAKTEAQVKAWLEAAGWTIPW